MWLESPKLSLGAYVGSFADGNVAGQSIRTMADLKSLGEPEGEVHMDQLISISGMKKAEGKRFRRELMKLRVFDEQLAALGLGLGSTEAEVEAVLEARRKEREAAEARELAEADSDIASVYLENRILKACRNRDVATGMDTLKDMLQTGAAVAPSERVLSALIIGQCEVPFGKGLKKAFKLLQYSLSPEVPVDAMPSSDAVVAFLAAMLQVGPDEGSVDAAQDILVEMHEKGWPSAGLDWSAGLTKEVKLGVRALKEAVKAAAAEAEGMAGAQEAQAEQGDTGAEQTRGGAGGAAVEDSAVGVEGVSVELDDEAADEPARPPLPPPPPPAAVLPAVAAAGPSAAALKRAAADDAPKPAPPPLQRSGSYASIPNRTYSSSPTAVSTALVATTSRNYASSSGSSSTEFDQGWSDDD